MEQLFTKVVSVTAIILGFFSMILWTLKDAPPRKKLAMIVLSVVIMMGAGFTLLQSTHFR